MWLKQVAVAVDQLVNALAGGWADETLSSRAYRESPRLERLINALLWFDKDHCYESYVSEQLRNQCPPELRQAALLAQVPKDPA
jgi:hypothetical protein